MGKGTIRNPDYVAPRQDTGGTTAGAPGAGVDSSSRYVWQDCQFCDGGKKTCTSCNGSGKLPLKGNTYSVSDQCRECRGTGRSMCLYCGGQGGKQVREP